MSIPKTVPYGSWPSVISGDMVAANTIRLSEPQLDGSDCYWLESRPQEKGRTTIVWLDDSGRRQDIVSAPMDVRTRAHEYGGGCYCIDDGVVYFTNNDDQCIYCLDTKTDDRIPQRLTAPGPLRYADLSIDRRRRRLLCVCEQHFTDKPAANYIVGIDLPPKVTDHAEDAITILVSGNDFYSNPRLSPDGRLLSWLTWNHPHMPWDSSECWLAAVTAAGAISQLLKVAGNGDESIFQPQWSPDGQLFFVADSTDWWNIYRYHIDSQQTTAITAVDAEFAMPQWQFGMSCYGFLTASTLLCCYSRQGRWYLATVDLISDITPDTASPAQPRLSAPLSLPLTTIESVHCRQQRALLIGSSATRLPSVYRWSQQSTPEKALTQLATSGQLDFSDRHIAVAEEVTFYNRENNAVHGFYYPPTHADVCGPAHRQPPLIVTCHGGPTAAAQTALNLKIQYWSNRGFAVLDVNYTGSSGYGRSYRQRLYGHWGVLDVDDICSGADYLIARGKADRKRVAVRGSSAGGYTVLAALTFRDTFKAGASLYGIGDLTLLAADTHKFEAHYLDKLVGPYPEKAALYRRRSPVYHADQLTCPVIFLQGLDDKVVPPNQARAMAAALKEKGTAVALLEFAGEGHGFRKSETIRSALQAEYAFYADIFSLSPSEYPQSR